jgi:hypothetical protein
MKIQTLCFAAVLAVLTACNKSENPTPNPTGTGGTENPAGAIGAAAQVAKQGEAVSKVSTALGGLQTTLAGITDGPTATAAKAKLETLIADLKTSLGELANSGKLMEAVSAKFGANKDQLMSAVSTRVQALMNNEQVKAAIGPVLQQLQNLVK